MHSIATSPLRRLILVPVIGLAVSACGSAPSSTTTATAAASSSSATAAASSSSATAAGSSSSATATIAASASDSQAPEASPSDAAASEPPGGTTSGDVPDNAVFLTYKGANPGFSIQYVEGWQVTPQSDGVIIKDKDSSETVAIVAPAADVAAYVASTDLPALQTQPGFKLIKQDAVKAGKSNYVHLAFHLTSPPDPVTGKQVRQTVERYYVPGPNALAVVSLATPDGVDNVDAFRQMIESFTWS